MRGIRGRGALGKTVVFGVLKRGEYVSVHIVKSCSAKELMPIIKQHVGRGSTIYTDVFKTYMKLPKEGYEKHFAVEHGNNEFAKCTLMELRTSGGCAKAAFQSSGA